MASTVPKKQRQEQQLECQANSQKYFGNAVRDQGKIEAHRATSRCLLAYFSSTMTDKVMIVEKPR